MQFNLSTLCLGFVPRNIGSGSISNVESTVSATFWSNEKVGLNY